MKYKKNLIMVDIPPENINPTDFETTFGELVPWGGAMNGGAFVRSDGTVVGEEGEDEGL